jgi:hypothetical protein
MVILRKNLDMFKISRMLYFFFAYAMIVCLSLAVFGKYSSSAGSLVSVHSYLSQNSRNSATVMEAPIEELLSDNLDALPAFKAEEWIGIGKTLGRKVVETIDEELDED